MDQLLTTRETAELVGFKEQTLKNWRATGRGPAFIRVNGRSVRYRLDAVQAWITAQDSPAQTKPLRMY